MFKSSKLGGHDSYEVSRVGTDHCLGVSDSNWV